MVGGWRSRTTISVQVTGNGLSGPDVERHSVPAPGIDLQLHGRRTFPSGEFRATAPRRGSRELTAHQVSAFSGGMAFRTLTFSSRIDSLSVRTGGSIAILASTWNRWFWMTSRIAPFHRKSRPGPDSEVLRHGDLDAFDMVSIPERLEERVGEAEEDHVVHLSLAQVMIDSVDGGFIEGLEQGSGSVPGPRPDHARTAFRG